MQLARALLVLVVIGSSASAAPSKDRIAAAEKVYKGYSAQLASGRTTVELPYLWSVRWLEASIDGADAKATKQAFADHLARMKTLEAERAKARDAGAASPADADSATYFRIEAEIWAARSKK
jgi:hypothetical protein